VAKSAPKKNTGTNKNGQGARAAARRPARGTPARAAAPAKTRPGATASAAKSSGKASAVKGGGRGVATVPLDREPRRTANRQASQAADAAREARARSSPRSNSALVAGRPQNASANNRPPRRNEPTVAIPVPVSFAQASSAGPGGKPPKNQAGLSPKEIEHFRDLLLEKRRELVGDMSSMEREALRTSGGSNLSTLPIHMADMGTDNYEQEFTLGLVEKDRNLLREINHALAKILNGTYGICEGTGKPISKPRLEAQPWARFSIEYARSMEKGPIRY
jgi:RNA polymerase-binding transcription factor